MKKIILYIKLSNLFARARLLDTFRAGIVSPPWPGTFSSSKFSKLFLVSFRISQLLIDRWLARKFVKNNLKLKNFIDT